VLTPPCIRAPPNTTLCIVCSQKPSMRVTKRTHTHPVSSRLCHPNTSACTVSACLKPAWTPLPSRPRMIRATNHPFSGPCMATPTPAALAVKGKGKTMHPKIVKRDCCRSVRSFELGERSLVSKASSVIPSHPAISLSISTVEPHVHSILTLQINVYYGCV